MLAAAIAVCVGVFACSAPPPSKMTLYSNQGKVEVTRQSDGSLLLSIDQQQWTIADRPDGIGEGESIDECVVTLSGTRSYWFAITVRTMVNGTARFYACLVTEKAAIAFMETARRNEDGVPRLDLNFTRLGEGHSDWRILAVSSSVMDLFVVVGDKSGAKVNSGQMYVVDNTGGVIIGMKSADFAVHKWNGFENEHP